MRYRFEEVSGKSTVAILLPNSDTLILHVPKTGGNWLVQALLAAGVSIEVVGRSVRNGHGDLHDHGHDRFTACFVRDPLEWYRSYWAYRTKMYWQPSHPDDENTKAEQFDTFVENVLVRNPGRVSRMYEGYAGSAANAIEFVGRQERLVADTVDLLERVEEKFDVRAIRRFRRVNQSMNKPIWRPDLAARCADSEKVAMRRFGYSF